MRVVIQRVKHAEINVNNIEISRIGKGLLVLLAVEESDTQKDIDWLVKKIVGLRIFDDTNGVMNLDVREINGEIMAVSQFTLFASTKKGNRPSYLRSAKPEISLPLYEKFLASLENVFSKPVACGQFGADMKIELLNDGPVTIIMDSNLKE